MPLITLGQSVTSPFSAMMKKITRTRLINKTRNFSSFMAIGCHLYYTESYYLYMRLQILPGKGMGNSLINIV
jgi:ethanolamine transporter EutH